MLTQRQRLSIGNSSSRSTDSLATWSGCQLGLDQIVEERHEDELSAEHVAESFQLPVGKLGNRMFSPRSPCSDAVASAPVAIARASSLDVAGSPGVHTPLSVSTAPGRRPWPVSPAS